MWLFDHKRKKKEKEEEAIAARQELIKELSKPLCQQKNGPGHLWEDFPPVIFYHSFGTAPYILVQESYVCRICGTRKDVNLEKLTWPHSIKSDVFNEALHEVEKKYKNLCKPASVVEDMINDAILVDRQRLKIWKQLHAPEEEKTTTHYEIKLKSTEGH